eukprot:gene5645-7795_t
MEINAEVWIRNEKFKDPQTDDLWVAGRVREKIIQPPKAGLQLQQIKVVYNSNDEAVISIPINAQETEDIKLKNKDSITDNLVNLSHLNEPEVLYNLKKRYVDGLIYTYCGPILIFIKPSSFHHDTDNSINNERTMLKLFVEEIVKKAISANFVLNIFSKTNNKQKLKGNYSEVKTKVLRRIKQIIFKNNLIKIRDRLLKSPNASYYLNTKGDRLHHTSSGFSEAPLADIVSSNLRDSSLKMRNDKYCIVISGESGSGKSETFKSVIKQLIVTTIETVAYNHIKRASVDYRSSTRRSVFGNVEKDVAKNRTSIYFTQSKRISWKDLSKQNTISSLNNAYKAESDDEHDVNYSALKALKSAPIESGMLSRSVSRGKSIRQTRFDTSSDYNDSKNVSPISSRELIGHQSTNSTWLMNTPVNNNKSTRVVSGALPSLENIKIDQIQKASVILDAFGSAKTMHNRNSSRFGKFVEVFFDSSGLVTGGHIRTYLLEYNRVLPSQESRWFKVFDLLLTGATSLEWQRWGLDPESFHMSSFRPTMEERGSNSSATTDIDNDLAAFTELKKNLDALGFEWSFTDGMFSALIGILHLNKMMSESEASLSSSNDWIVTVAKLLGFKTNEFRKFLTTKTLILGGDAVVKTLSTAAISNICGGLVKKVYQNIFDNSINLINAQISPVQNYQQCATIGILDLFGFECLPKNGLEQLCINYANESLQQAFSNRLFIAELREYERENLGTNLNILLPDNSAGLDLIRNGIFNLLDDHCKVPNPSERRFATQMYRDYKGNSRFSASATEQAFARFCILHYAGPVVYSVEGFMETNKGEISTIIKQFVNSSTNLAVGRRNDDDNHLGIINNDQKKNTHVNSAVRQFSSELDKLISDISTFNPRYIQCVKPVKSTIIDANATAQALPVPVFKERGDKSSARAATNPRFSPPKPFNGDKSAMNLFEKAAPNDTAASSKTKFNQNRVLEQLRYGGVLQVIRVTTMGYPIKYSFVDFYNQYRLCLNPYLPVHRTLPLIITQDDGDNSDAIEMCNQLILGLLTDHKTNEFTSKGIKRSKPPIWLQASLLNDNSESNAKPSRENDLIKIGRTKVFIKYHAYTALESSLLRIAKFIYKLHSFAIGKSERLLYKVTITSIKTIQNFIRYQFIPRRRFMKMKSAIQSLQKKFRLRKEVVKLVQTFGRFRKLVIKLQAFVRRKLAIKNMNWVTDIKSKAAMYQNVRLKNRRKTRSSIISSPRSNLAQSASFDDDWKKSFANKLIDYKMQDEGLLQEISESISTVQMSATESTLLCNIKETKSALSEWSNRIDDLNSSACLLELSNEVDYGYNLIDSNKIIPLTTLGKISSFGMYVKPEKRVRSAKFAPKSITAKHKMFQGIMKVIESIKRAITIVQAYQVKTGNLLQNRIDSIRFSKRSTAANSLERTTAMDPLPLRQQVDIATDITSYLNNILSYYQHYIKYFINEYGEGSAYFDSFRTPKEYLLALAKVTGKHEPLLDFEKKAYLLANGNNESGMNTSHTIFNPASSIDNSKSISKSSSGDADRSFDDNQISFNNKYSTMVRYKYNPFAPGIEFLMNSFHRLLLDESLPPTRLIRIVGKSSGNYGQETLVLASSSIDNQRLSGDLMVMKHN